MIIGEQAPSESELARILMCDNSNGTSIAEIENYLKKLGFMTISSGYDLEVLNSIGFYIIAAITKKGKNHAVVVEFSSQNAIIYDPELGILNKPKAQFYEEFTGKFVAAKK
jgi:ABC-type bacteriocin/lantibiotic exporter with double-glycine peptidase domain